VHAKTDRPATPPDLVGDEAFLHRQLLTRLLAAGGWLLIAVAALYAVYGGFAQLTNPAISLMAGCVDLSKPLRAAELQRALEDAVGRGG
jgi:hypothetical protein